MWVVGDWGQAPPWSRVTGVKMVKGADDVYTGELSLPKGSKFDIKILKSTVSTTSGGDNDWSAVRYSSTLNTSTSHNFGEFTDNLIPNGNFDEGAVKWTPAGAIVSETFAQSPHNTLILYTGTAGLTATSDRFTLPANQKLRLSGYVHSSVSSTAGGAVRMSVVDGGEELFNFSQTVGAVKEWKPFSKTFTTGGTPREAEIQLAATDSVSGIRFDSLSLVTP